MKAIDHALRNGICWIAAPAGYGKTTAMLDYLLRVLAISKDQACSLQDIYEWLWPDAEGDQAKAACEQALHRLRKLLSTSDLIVQREGKLYLSAQHTWVDFVDWERKLTHALRTAQDEVMQRALARVRRSAVPLGARDGLVPAGNRARAQQVHRPRGPPGSSIRRARRP